MAMRAEQFLERLVRDYPELRFRVGKRFKYRPPRTIYYEKLDLAVDVGVQKCDETYIEASGESDAGVQNYNYAAEGAMEGASFEQDYYLLQLLHEVGHALSGHRDYATDPERVKMEREAWEKARELCEKYEVRYDEEFVEMEMDTYRDWLHKKSTCKECGLTMYQTKDSKYHCPRCEAFGG